MNDTFLSRFLRVAKQITQAERGMAVNQELDLLDTVDLDEETLQDKTFNQFANIWLRRALDEETLIITNNIITEPSQAPTTNTNFTNLRVVVVIPVRGHGAIYLDQHIRRGIIARDVIERLTQMVNNVQQNGEEHLSEDQMIEIYEKLS
jgi:hypothetical protein